MTCNHHSTLILMPSASEAQKRNPALAPFDILIGTWTTVGTHPMVPSKVLHGSASFEWLEGGAFLVMRSEIDEPEIPTGIAIIGSDNEAGEFSPWEPDLSLSYTKTD